MKQAAERKLDGAAKVGSLEQAVLLFQNALSMRLSLPVHEEALFDLVRVIATHCSVDAIVNIHVLIRGYVRLETLMNFEGMSVVWDCASFSFSLSFFCSFESLVD